jgi:hypothetical protein
MTKHSNLFVASLSGALLLAGAGCGSSGKTTTTGSTVPLPSTATGFVQDLTGGSNVIGPWYAYGDGVGAGANTTTTDNANSDCVLKGGFPPTACSQIGAPTPGQPFVPTNLDTSEMCTWGTAAMVMTKSGSPDYSDLWGAGISLDLNNPGGDAGVKSEIDLSAFKGVSFDFSAYTGADSNGAGVPAGAMRVNFPFLGEHATDSPYWMGASKASSPLTPPVGGSLHVEALWTDVGGPYYLTQQSPAVTPPAFDVTKVQSIQFQVFTTATATTPYAFCVSNLALLKK